MIFICKNIREEDHGQITKKEYFSPKEDEVSSEKSKAKKAKSPSKGTDPKGITPGSPTQVG